MKKEIVEIRMHGRGGHGAKTAAHLLALAALDEGKYIQAFPEYGPERAGAPVKTYVKIADKKIKSFSPIKHAEIVVIIDSSLINESDIIKTLGKDCVIIANCKLDCEVCNDESCELYKIKSKYKTYSIEASDIAIQKLGKDIPNIVMLGALIKITNVVNKAHLINVIKDYFLEKIGKEKTEANILAFEEGYNKVK
ncbi:MAG: 2-oxoacid:acceptor oxidoreductase family protein [Nanoarchaeota archaeon]|nr:2-oxoacid:acceptor oxidoreductase family protein [Nanoarchaeota archaeon]